VRRLTRDDLGSTEPALSSLQLTHLDPDLAEPPCAWGPGLDAYVRGGAAVGLGQLDDHGAAVFALKLQRVRVGFWEPRAHDAPGLRGDPDAHAWPLEWGGADGDTEARSPRVCSEAPGDEAHPRLSPR
jgi:hypothetical protein